MTCRSIALSALVLCLSAATVVAFTTAPPVRRTRDLSARGASTRAHRRFAYEPLVASIGTSDAKPIYLDYSGTTPVEPRVIDAMLPYLRDAWGKMMMRVSSSRITLQLDSMRTCRAHRYSVLIFSNSRARRESLKLPLLRTSCKGRPGARKAAGRGKYWMLPQRSFFHKRRY